MQIQNINNYQNKRYNNQSFKMNIKIYQKADREPLEFDEFKKAFLDITKDVPGLLELFDKGERLKICYTDALGKQYKYYAPYATCIKQFNSNTKDDRHFRSITGDIFDELVRRITHRFMKENKRKDEQQALCYVMNLPPHDRLIHLRDALLWDDYEMFNALIKEYKENHANPKY